MQRSLGPIKSDEDERCRAGKTCSARVGSAVCVFGGGEP